MQGLGERSRVISRPLLDPLAWAFMFSLSQPDPSSRENILGRILSTNPPALNQVT